MTRKNTKNKKYKKTLRNKKMLKNKKTLRNIKIVHIRQKNNRTKKGGLFSRFFKTGPSQEETNEFVNRFTMYINDIIRLQQSKKQQPKKQQQQLYEKVNETINYINNISNNVDKNISITNDESAISGLPIYIVGRFVEKKTYRDNLINSLKNKGFSFNETVLNDEVNQAEERRNIDVQIKPSQKQETIKNIKPVTKTQTQIITAMKPNNTVQLENILTDKKAREIEEKRLFDEQQKRIKQDIENRINERKIAEENEKIKRKEIEKANIEAIKQEQLLRQQNEILPKREATIVRPVEPTSKEINEVEQNIAEIKEAEDNDENFKLLMADEQNANTIVIQDAPSEPQKDNDPQKDNESIDVEEPNLVQTITIIKHEPYEINTLPQYWLKYFPHDMLYAFRDCMLSMLDNPVNLGEIIKSYFPALRINKQDDKYISALMSDKKISLDDKDYYKQIYENNLKTSIDFILLYIGIISNILLYHYNPYDRCFLILKGGKAIQMNCSKGYESNDIDILIVSQYDTVNKKELAIEISKLLVWIVSKQNKIKQLSMVEVDKLESLIKISMITEYGYQALVDIGYHIPKEEVRSYFEISNLFISNVYNLPFTYFLNGQPLLITYQMCFISQSIEQMIEEKIYFYIKYIILKNYTVNDNAVFFIPKIIRSIGKLLTCNINISDKQISKIIYKVKTEKEKYLKGVTEIPSKRIVEEVISIVQDFITKNYDKK